MIDAPELMRTHRPDVPEVWDQFIDRALAKDPAHRYASAQEMRNALPPA